MRKYSQIWRCFTLALCGMLHGIELFKNLNLSLIYRGFPGGKESTCSAGDMVRSLGGEDPLEKETAMPSTILAWKPHGQRRLFGCSQRVAKQSDTT